MEAWLDEARGVPLHKMCVMSTCLEDMAYVAQLADAEPAHIVPCFGVHPWMVHAISLKHPAPRAEDHYHELLGDDAHEWVAALPAPVSLHDVVQRVSELLERFPAALVGEVGLDRSFRIADPTAQPRRLTPLQTPLAHQRAVLDAHVQLACRYRRSLSVHCVRATGATLEALQEAARDAAFADIGVLLHSCTMSATAIEQVQRQYANVYVSFSTYVPQLTQRGKFAPGGPRRAARRVRPPAAVV